MSDSRDDLTKVIFYHAETGEICEIATIMHRWYDNGGGNIVPHYEEILERQILREPPFPLHP